MTLCQLIGFIIVMGDFNGDLGNSLGDKAKHEPNQRGLKLLDFANYFNFCPVNLMGTCHGQLKHIFLTVADIVPRLIIYFCLRFSKNIWYARG